MHCSCRYEGIVAASRVKHKGCVQYDLLQSQDNPSQFRMIEAWSTKEMLEAHAQSPEMQEKRKLQESDEFKDCGPTSRTLDTSYQSVFD